MVSLWLVSLKEKNQNCLYTQNYFLKRGTSLPRSDKGGKKERVWDRGGDARDSTLMTQLHVDPGGVSDWLLRSFEFSRESNN